MNSSRPAAGQMKNQGLNGRTTVPKLLSKEPDVITADETPLSKNDLESMNASGGHATTCRWG
jgi:hypothetical protein